MISSIRSHSLVIAIALAAVVSGCASSQSPAPGQQLPKLPASGGSGSSGGSADVPAALPETLAPDTGFRTFEDSLAVRGFAQNAADPSVRRELHRIWIDNRAGGFVRGSRDGGKTWTELGSVIYPITGGVWRPTIDGGVLAFNFLRGESNMFATAVNALHMRFSDPAGYELPADPKEPLVAPRGVSLYPADIENYTPPETGARLAVLSMKGGTGIFGSRWSPRIGSKAYMGDGTRFAPIPYDVGPDSGVPSRSHLMIVTPKTEREMSYIEFENKAQGRVLVKYRDSSRLEQVAKVLQPVLGTGRFVGSEFVPYPGSLRANHAGVFCIGTTDIKTDLAIPAETPLNELRGGFQIVPSHHYLDASMNGGGGHGFVYMVVGPTVDPADLDRYDRGVDGRYPLFFDGMRAGGGQTYFKFVGANGWFTIKDAIKLKKFTRADGTVIEHLRGVIQDAFHNVEGIRYAPCPKSLTQDGQSCDP